VQSQAHRRAAGGAGFERPRRRNVEGGHLRVSSATAFLGQASSTSSLRSVRRR
jgi:hypothetical protein